MTRTQANRLLAQPSLLSLSREAKAELAVTLRQTAEFLEKNLDEGPSPTPRIQGNTWLGE